MSHLNNAFNASLMLFYSCNPDFHAPECETVVQSKSVVQPLYSINFVATGYDLREFLGCEEALVFVVVKAEPRELELPLGNLEAHH